MNNLEALMELAKLSASRHDERRKFEWKVTFGFWALIVVAIAKKPELALINDPVWVGILILGIFAFMWLRGVWVANTKDKRWCRRYEEEAIAIVVDPAHSTTRASLNIRFTFWEKCFRFLGDWSMQFQLVVAIILIIVYYLMPAVRSTQAPVPTP